MRIITIASIIGLVCSTLATRSWAQHGFSQPTESDVASSLKCEVQYDGTAQWVPVPGSYYPGARGPVGIKQIKKADCEVLYKNAVCPTSDFVKHGNNGTVSCNTYCSSQQWGGPTSYGGCRSATRADLNKAIDCNDVPGLLPNANELTCTCIKETKGHHWVAGGMAGTWMRMSKEADGWSFPGLAIDSKKLCPVQAYTPPNIVITSATYGGNYPTIPKGNVTAKVSTACNGKVTCNYKIDYTVLGDPKYGSPKQFSVDWNCPQDPNLTPDNRSRTVDFEASGTTLRISCESGVDPWFVMPAKGPGYYKTEPKGTCNDDRDCDGARKCECVATYTSNCGAGDIYGLTCSTSRSGCINQCTGSAR